MEENKISDARRKASEKYRQEHKQNYNEYYSRYRKEHPPKNYYKIYKKRLDDIFDYLASHEVFYKEKNGEYVSCDREIFDIARGEHDEK